MSIYGRVEEVQREKERIQREEEEEIMQEAMKKQLLKEEGGGERVQDKNYEDFAPIARVALPIDRIPEDLQKRMVKVFSKHRVFMVREWSRKLMQSY